MSFTYVGEELSLFREATNWKQYWSSQIADWLTGDVLEAGAGIGGTTEAVPFDHVDTWTCLEPDADFVETLRMRIQSGELPSRCAARRGTTADLAPGELFDCVLYADVIEHIEDDRSELEQAARHLNPGGYIIVLSPAHQWLFTPFDEAVGHFRRYSRRSALDLTPSGCQVHTVRMLDSVGLLASLGNKLLLQSSIPTENQIAIWDKGLVPVSRLLDRLFGYRLGKSVLAVWQKM